MKRALKRVSHPFQFTQDYRAYNERPPLDDYPLYSESFSIGKISTKSTHDIIIKNLQIESYIFKSKQALTNPVSLVFIMANNLEGKLFTDKLLLDQNQGFFAEYVPGSRVNVNPVDLVIGNLFNAAYQGVLQYGINPYDYLNNPKPPPNYPNYSAANLVKDSLIGAIFLLNGTTFNNPGEIVIPNSNQYDYLYIIPYTPNLQYTALAASGRVNFEVEL